MNARRAGARGEGNRITPSRWQKTTTLAKATCELSFSLFTPLGAGKPFLLYVPENYCFPGTSQKVNIWLSLQTKCKVAFSRRHLLSPCGTDSAKVRFCCILTNTSLFASNTNKLLCFQPATAVNGPSHCTGVEFESQWLQTPNPETKLHTRRFSAQLLYK